MIEFLFDVLTRDLAILHGQVLLSLNSDSEWENWTLENLLVDRPGKWELSWIAWHEQTPIGYVVASQHEGAVHVHRLVVGLPWRGLRIGRRLIWNVASAARCHGVSEFTLKVHKQNSHAITFYESCGFRSAEKQAGEYVFMSTMISDVLQICK